MNLIQIYQERVEKFAEIAESLKSKYNRLSLVRLILFIGVIGLIIFLWSLSKGIAAVFAVLFLVGFGWFMRWHLGMQREQIHHEHLTKINQLELLALLPKNEQAGLGNTQAFGAGESFVSPEHPYSVDLDIFGAYSFFQFTNRTSTTIGDQRLAQYMMQAATITEIEARQKAIAELKDKIDWRQDFQAYGMVAEDKLQHVTLLKKWLLADTKVLHTKWLRPVMLFAPPVIIAVFVYIFMNLPWAFLLIPLGVPLLILRQFLEHVNEVSRETNEAEKVLAFYARLIQHSERESFSTKKLADLRQMFLGDNIEASRQISKLSYLISQLNVRDNAFAILLNIFGLWDLQWTYQLEKWKVKNAIRLPQWFDALAELEALSSLATSYYNNPDWVFPTIHDELSLIGKDLGHPLIPKSERITNSLQMPTNGHIKLVTGSNMAGKSTLLRTVGLNIVLAMIGAPVCASEFRLPLLKVYTSMRTQDALHENTSSFYAELKRLKFIIDAVENGENIFFLLDEILKGTNSRDRHSGSKALINQLINHKGSGMVATHDLELGAMEATAEGSIENLCMEVEVQNGKLIFDYKIKKGVSQSFNATHLMREMGINV